MRALARIGATNVYVEADNASAAARVASYCASNGITDQAGLDGDIDNLVEAVFTGTTQNNRNKLKVLLKLSVSVVTL